MEDKELIEGIKQKDDKAILEAHKKYEKLVYSIIYEKLHNNEDTEDVALDVFNKMCTKINQIKTNNLKNWLASIARNTAENYRVRDQIKNNAALLDDTIVQETKDNSNSLGKYEDIINDNFDDESKRILLLHIVHGYSFSMIGKELNISKTDAYRKFTEAFNKLKKLTKHLN